MKEAVSCVHGHLLDLDLNADIAWNLSFLKYKKPNEVFELKAESLK